VKPSGERGVQELLTEVVQAYADGCRDSGAAASGLQKVRRYQRVVELGGGEMELGRAATEGFASFHFVVSNINALGGEPEESSFEAVGGYDVLKVAILAASVAE
jgi:hypothetical protein